MLSKFYSYLLMIFSGLGLFINYVIVKDHGSNALSVYNYTAIILLILQVFVAYRLSQLRRSGIIGAVLIASIWFIWTLFFTIGSLECESAQFCFLPTSVYVTMNPIVFIPTILSLLSLSISILIFKRQEQ